MNKDTQPLDKLSIEQAHVQACQWLESHGYNLEFPAYEILSAYMREAADIPEHSTPTEYPAGFLCQRCERRLASTQGGICEECAKEPFDEVPAWAETPAQPPLDRMIELVTGNLVREAPQIDAVPLLQKASVIAALYQAKALQEIAGTLVGIREACEGLEQIFESCMFELEDGGTAINTWDNR